MTNDAFQRFIETPFGKTDLDGFLNAPAPFRLEKPIDDQTLAVVKYQGPGSNATKPAAPRKSQAYIAYAAGKNAAGENESYLVVCLFGKRIPIDSTAKPSVLPVSVESIDELLVDVETEITHRGLNCHDITHTTQDSKVGKTYVFPSEKTIKELAILAYQMQSQYK